jgi:nitrite reductase (NADH) large subunit
MSEPLVVVGNGMAATRFVDELMRGALVGSTPATSLKVSGVNVFSAGTLRDAPGSNVITLEDEGAQSYKRLIMRDGRLTGTVLFGDTADALWYLDLIRSGADVSRVRDGLAFGPAIALRQAA